MNGNSEQAGGINGAKMDKYKLLVDQIKDAAAAVEQLTSENVSFQNLFFILILVSFLNFDTFISYRDLSHPQRFVCMLACSNYCVIL